MAGDTLFCFDGLIQAYALAISSYQLLEMQAVTAATRLTEFATCKSRDTFCEISSLYPFDPSFA
jgi:hypothetical protein